MTTLTNQISRIFVTAFIDALNLVDNPYSHIFVDVDELISELVDESKESEEGDTEDEDEDEDETEDEPELFESWLNTAPVSLPASVDWLNVTPAPVTSQEALLRVDSWLNTTPAPEMPAAPEVLDEEEEEVLRVTTGLDSRGRACVPASISDHIGLQTNQHVYIAKRAHSLPGLVILQGACQTGHLSTYSVDKHRNVRLSAAVLKKGGLQNAKRIKFRTTDDGMGIIVLEG